MSDLDITGPVKLVFTGPTGAGKTTAITALSEIPPVKTEVRATDHVAAMKDTTTVAMDYGQLTLEGGQVLQLFGTPGQERFAYMREILTRGGLGLIVLVDNASDDPISDMDHYLTDFAEFAAETTAVVGVVRSDLSPEPAIDAYYAYLAERGLEYPILYVDVRKREDVVLLIEVLLAGLEFA